MAAATINPGSMDAWVDQDGPVALCLKQRWIPVEGEGEIFFPPTYVDIGYNIDVLYDGTKMATVDSVGSQANRMEPLFLAAAPGKAENPLAQLVPQIDIEYRAGKSVSLLEAGHRLGDALIRCSELGEEAKQAFELFLEEGDASLIATLAPTSLVFGVWDSRDTSAKLPRILQSVIRAKDVERLTRSAQYHPALNYEEVEVFGAEDRKKQREALSERGFLDAPAVGTHGGVVARGPIERSITINLIALRRLDGKNAQAMRRYILGLALVAATAPLDGYLRQGCLLTPDPSAPSSWEAVGRDGQRQAIAIDHQSMVEYAKKACAAFGKGKDRRVKFDSKTAKADVKSAKKAKKETE